MEERGRGMAPWLGNRSGKTLAPVQAPGAWKTRSLSGPVCTAGQQGERAASPPSTGLTHRPCSQKGEAPHASTTLTSLALAGRAQQSPFPLLPPAGPQCCVSVNSHCQEEAEEAHTSPLGFVLQNSPSLPAVKSCFYSHIYTQTPSCTFLKTDR